MAKEAVVWKKLNTDALPSEAKSAFQKLEKAYAELERAQENFESATKPIIKIPDEHKGKEVAFNYTGKMCLVGFKQPSKIAAKNLFSDFINP